MIRQPTPNHARRPFARLSLGALALLAALTAPAGPVAAQCVQVDDTVTCSGVVSGGFDAGAQQALTLEVEPDSTLENPAGDALRVNDDSTVNVRDTATVRATQAGAGAIAAGANATILLEPEALVEADGGVAVDAGDESNLVNQGTVRTTGDGATGIRIGSNPEPTTDVNNPRGIVSNQGAIEMVGDGVTGIAAGDRNHQVTNFSTLRLVGDDAVGMRLGDENASDPIGTLDTAGSTELIAIEGDRGVGIAAGSGNEFQNVGQITVTGAEGIGVRLDGNNDFSNVPALRNEREVGRIEVTGVDGIGVLLGADGGTDDRVENLGTIVGGSGERGAAISTDVPGASGTHTIRNEAGGELIAGSNGVAIRGGSGVEIVRNAGSIVGDVRLEAGDDSFRPRGGGTVEGLVDGGAGSDSVILSGNDSGIFDAAGVTNFEQLELRSSAWTLRGDAQFAEGVTIQSGTNTGLILDSPASLLGDLSLADGAIVQAVFNASSGEHGSLSVDGAIDVGDAVLLSVVSTEGFATTGRFPLLSATGSITASGEPFEGSLPDDTAFLGFALDRGASDVSLVVSRLRSYASLAQDANQAAVAGNLDLIGAADPTGGMATLLGAVNGLAADQAPATYQSLQPEAYDAHTSTLISLGSAIVDEVASVRLRCDRTYAFQQYARNEVQPDPCGDQGRTLWVDGLVTYSRRDPKKGHIDFDATSGALLVGADLAAAGWQLSPFVGASYSAIEVGDVGDGDFAAFELGALAQRSFWGFQFQTVALYGHGWHEQQRAIRLAGAPATPDARGRFDSDHFVSRSEIAYRWDIGAFELEPLTQLQYTFVSETPFKESRAGGARLAVAERRVSQLRSAFGARLAYEGLQYYWLNKWLTWIDGTWRAELEGRWVRVWSGDERAIQSGFRDAPDGVPGFRVEGKDIRKAAIFGTRVQFQPLNSPVVIGLGYDFQFGDDTVAHRGSLRLQVPF